jgi:hypothetical protein
VPAVASASPPSPVTGYTDIDGNTATASTIDGYARHADGSLTALPGSPFAAAPTPMRLVDEGDGVAAVAGVEMPVLTAAMVRETLERTRR